MADLNIDWTNDAFITLDEAAKLIPGADRESLKRLARRGILKVYKPGKAYMTTAADVREAVIKCRVIPTRERPPRSTPVVPNSLGLTETNLAGIRLDLALGIRQPAQKVERLSEEERARAALAHRLKMQERRRARARKRYREKKAERAKELPDHG